MTNRYLKCALLLAFTASLRAVTILPVSPLPGVTLGNWDDNGIWGYLYGGLRYPGDTSVLLSNYPSWQVGINADNTITLQGAGGGGGYNVSPTGVQVSIAFGGTLNFIEPSPSEVILGGFLMYSTGPTISNSGTLDVRSGWLGADPTSPGFNQGPAIVNNNSGVITLSATGPSGFARLDFSGDGNSYVQGEFLNQGNVVMSGADNYLYGSQDVATSLVNQGTIKGGGTVADTAVSNSGDIEANNSDSLVISDSSIVNTGTVTADSGSTLSFQGSTYTQTAGSTKVFGTLSSNAALDIDGGTIGGSGTISANVVVNGGAVVPGDPQTFTIDGSFTLDSGSIDMTLLGSDPADQDHIIFDGAADFAGGNIDLTIPLDVDLNGDSLDLFTFDEGFSGTLPTFTFTNGQNYTVDETSDESGVHFEFSGNTVTASNTPEPASLLLCLGALGMLLAVARRRRSEVKTAPQPVDC